MVTREKGPSLEARLAGWACPLCAAVYAPQVVECARCNDAMKPIPRESRAIILWLRSTPEYTVVYYPYQGGDRVG